ncbi:MAG: YggS family pyridoxal phosphate-dependent enzyme [Dehalococcoidales bacterium]|nr:YggS family pyridoxal phosphate-dependent enzyme [Dehalococcoidales bacterium]
MIDGEEMRRRIAGVRERIAQAASGAGRDPGDVTLVAVCKTMPREAVETAYEAGLRHFGENRVQEAAGKFAEFRPADLTLHLIGHLQRNKAKQALSLFDMVHSLDSLALAEALAKRGDDGARPLPVLVEVNVAGEESKFGVGPAETLPLLLQVARLPGLLLQGLMTIAPLVDDPETVRPFFRRLRELREEGEQRLGRPLPHLSMGMTNDFEVAIAEGATIVRVGRAIFGERG